MSDRWIQIAPGVKVLPSMISKVRIVEDNDGFVKLGQLWLKEKRPIAELSDALWSVAREVAKDGGER